MKASEIRLEDFLTKSDTQFVIPIYQRNYDWGKFQCEQLLNDILEVGKTKQPHFIGSIVYIHDGVYTTGIKELIIIDGQQRLTTITLIYIALYNYARENEQVELANKIFEKYIINKFADNNGKLKLKPTENNSEDLKALINRTQISTLSKYSNIIDNYNFFKNQISETNYKTILDGMQMLMFVEISLERSHDNAQRIFESLNSTGLNLSQADLIRNYILMEKTSQEQKTLYEQYWEYIEKNTKVESTKDNKLSDFIRDYLTYSRQNIVNKDKVYQTFKKEFPINDLRETEKSLDEIKNLSTFYGRLIDPTKEPDTEIRKEIANINQLEINTSYPFLMKVYDDYHSSKIDKESFIRILCFIQTFAFRRFILDLPTNVLNKIFMSLYKQINPSNYEQSLYKYIMSLTGRQRMPKDPEIREALKDKDIYNSKSKNRNYLFESLENYENKETHIDISNNDNLTIEHIFPQNPDQQWRLAMSKEEYMNFSQKYLHTIGNLTLSGNNSALGNKTFIQKRDKNEDGKEQGYTYSKLWLNQDLKSMDSWNTARYQERTERITNRFLDIWKLPDGSYEVNENNGINIFEAGNPTGKILEYATFFDEKIPSNQETSLSYRSLYIYVVKTVYNLTPENFITKLGTNLSIISSAESLTHALPLDNTYYIEGNLSSRDIFNRIKMILKTFDLEDELMIKFKTEITD